MSPSQSIVRPQFELRVNGVAGPAIRFSMSHDEPDDFDILVDDAILGTLAITADCILELREAGTDWRTVTLDDLKGVLLGDSESLTTHDLPEVSEMFERRRFDRLDEVGLIHRRSPQLAELTGHADCLKRVQALFYRAGLPHKSAGTVFVVPNLRLARTVLCQEGFYPSPVSRGALVEPQTRCAVQLIEQSH
jgi:hypothetical protein